MLKILKEFKIRLFPQYYDGFSIYGKEQGKYEEVRTLNEHYKDHENEIQKLLDKIESIKEEFKSIKSELGSLKKSSEKFDKFIDTYDTLSVRDFIMGELNN
jgi:archaellum component FlaC